MLAKEIVTFYHGEKKAEETQKNWENVFSKKEIPTEVETFSVKEGTSLVDVFLSHKIISSKSEFRRLVEEGAVTNMDTNEKVLTPNDIIKGGVYRIGKKRFCKIEIN
jgi:tyrosyl-tRNA synthetase